MTKDSVPAALRNSKQYAKIPTFEEQLVIDQQKDQM